MNHFSNLFGNSIDFSPGLYLLNTLNLPTITYSDATALTRKATDDEIKRSLFAMNHHSFSGPDGLTVGFFTSTWTIIGPYFCKAVHNFFDKCKLLREVNTTNIALIPKTSHPSSMSSFRSISWSNVVYKCISKILATRLVTILPNIISTNQATFLLGHCILDNILLPQVLLKGHGKATSSHPLFLSLTSRKHMIVYNGLQLLE